MKTVVQNIEDRADQIRDELQVLLVEYSEIYRWNHPGSMIISADNYSWRNLSEEGGRLQAKLLETYRRYYSLLSCLLRGAPESSLDELAKTNERISEAIDQSSSTHIESVGQARSRVEEAFDSQLSLLGRLYDSSKGHVIYVPDTNALFFNTELEEWDFSESGRFQIALTPSVLKELDEQKMRHNREAVRKKADKLIRKIKEYRRRGRLTEGVPLRKPRSTIRAYAVEPRVQESLEWLDEDSADDRLLASVVEIMRSAPQSPVVLVTRDINLQNKAEFAGLPFVEPPDCES